LLRYYGAERIKQEIVHATYLRKPVKKLCSEPLLQAFALGGGTGDEEENMVFLPASKSWEQVKENLQKAVRAYTLNAQ